MTASYGVVQFYNSERHEGRILPYGGHETIYFTREELVQRHRAPQSGDRVCFRYMVDGQRRPWAAEVVVIGRQIGGFRVIRNPPLYQVRRNGTVAWFCHNGRGFGFITPDQPGRDIYIHRSQVVPAGDLAPGTRVMFYLGYDRQGRIHATEVKPFVGRIGPLVGAIQPRCKAG